MSPDIENIPLSPSLRASNEADFPDEHAITVNPSGASQYLPLPTPKGQNLNSPSQAMTDFTDGSDALFSMYNEMAADRDRKLAENWREDANATMLLVSQHDLPPRVSQAHWMIEWLDISHCRGISVTVLSDISNKLSRRLSLLPFPALPAPGSQFE
jgi:hypothetical protein